MSDDSDRTASLMTPAKLAQLKVRPAAAASPAAFLDQLAADAGSGHVRRLLDLRRQLEGQLGEIDHAAACAACAALADALGQLDFSLLQPRGWLARATGKGKEAAAAFAAQQERSARAGEDLADAVRKLQRQHQALGAAIDRGLVEFDVEVRAIEKVMDQGARWLQDMRNQLKAREAAGGDPEALQKIADDNRRCELLVARLKLLRAANGAAQQVVEHGRAVASRRGAVLASLQALLEGEWQGARRKLAALAEQALASGSAAEGVEPARQAQQAVLAASRQAADDCAALQSQAQALAGELSALQEPLAAAA